MDREIAYLDVSCIEQVINESWHDFPARSRRYYDPRFRLRDLTKERAAILDPEWATDVVLSPHKTPIFVSYESAESGNDTSPSASARHDIDALLIAMNQGTSLSRSAEYLESCRRIAEDIRATDSESVDVDGWSKTLADDLSKFAD